MSRAKYDADISNQRHHQSYPKKKNAFRQFPSWRQGKARERAFWEHGPFGNNGGPFGNKGGPFGNNRWAFWEQQVGLMGTGPFVNWAFWEQSNCYNKMYPKAPPSTQYTGRS